MKINEVYQLLTSTYVDWAHMLANPHYIRTSVLDAQCITWDDRVSHMLDHPVMASDVARLADEKQYTFQMINDGSLIQVYYKYNTKGNNLQSARLAFYSARTDTAFINKNDSILNSMDKKDGEMNSNEEDLDEDSDFIEDIIGPSFLSDGPVSWLRIDYEPRDAKGVLHHDCHMHFSAFPDSRFVVDGIPTPAQFIEFIMAFCYPEIYEKHRLNDQGTYMSESKIAAVNSASFPLAENRVFSQIVHFRVPVTYERNRR